MVQVSSAHEAAEPEAEAIQAAALISGTTVLLRGSGGADQTVAAVKLVVGGRGGLQDDPRTRRRTGGPAETNAAIADFHGAPCWLLGHDAVADVVWNDKVHAAAGNATLGA